MMSCAAGTAVAAASPSDGVSCRDYRTVPVGLGPGRPFSASILGQLCATPRELRDGETVQLLVHGATYDHRYWDFGTVDGVSYSYARDLAAAGFPTFAIDEIGAGQSSHPPSTQITMPVAAYVEHAIVQDLLGGAFCDVRFGRVIDVGHSLGSLTSWLEAATYHDVAGVIITGAVPDTTIFSENVLLPDFYPAIDDPAFAGGGLDAGYLATWPGTRGTLFDNDTDADPNVIAADEASKDAVSGTELASSGGLLNPTLTQQTDVPVLVIVGGDDAIFCGPLVSGGSFSCTSGQAVQREEAPAYFASAQLQACVVPGSGHDINLALDTNSRMLTRRRGRPGSSDSAVSPTGGRAWCLRTAAVDRPAGSAWGQHAVKLVQPVHHAGGPTQRRAPVARDATSALQQRRHTDAQFEPR